MGNNAAEKKDEAQGGSERAARRLVNHGAACQGNRTMTERIFNRVFETLGGVAFVVAILTAVWFAAVIFG